MKNYIVYKCKVCECVFVLPKEYVRTNENKGNYLSCPFRGHKNIAVAGSYDSVKECMDNHVYVREGGRMRQIK